MARDATARFMSSPAVLAKFAETLGVAPSDITLAFVRGTDLQEANITLPSDKTKAVATVKRTNAEPAYNVEQRRDELTLAYMKQHPATNYAKALAHANSVIAREAVEKQVAKYDTELATLAARKAELDELKAAALKTLRVVAKVSK